MKYYYQHKLDDKHHPVFDNHGFTVSERYTVNVSLCFHLATTGRLLSLACVQCSVDLYQQTLIQILLNL